MSRLPSSAASASTAAASLRFSFDGKEHRAYEGDTIGSTTAAGRRTFSRSFKYHRRRGLMCCAGQCPNCLVVGRRARRARLHRAGARGCRSVT